MIQNPLNQGMIEENSVGIGQISTDMLEERSEELALIAGRPVTTADDDQALRELKGEDEMDAKQLLLESFTEDKRWDPVFSSTGSQVEQIASEYEDEDGRNQSAQLYEEGISEAAHDQMLQSAIATAELSRAGAYN